MFVDRVSIFCHAGDGGDGCLSFRREAHVPRGGPDGGDGGDGGDVIVRADSNLGSLANLAGHRFWNGRRGDDGGGCLCSGRDGAAAEILVPPGTLVKDVVTGELVRDLAQNGDTLIVCKGGRGGRGNKRFATPTNRTPREIENGGHGEKREILLELKLIADVGVVGKPNAGKSTLLARMTRATPEIASYPFTTKFPNLGVVPVDDDFQFVMADIPGLIAGASEGIGLGHEFLRHIQRTRVLIHLVEPDPDDQTNPVENYHQIRHELGQFDPTLLERPEVLAISKCELPDAQAAADLLRESIHSEIFLISSATGAGIPELLRAVLAKLRVESVGI